MPKTYSEGHKAREITLAEAAIVKLREAKDKALGMRLAATVKAQALRVRADEMDGKATKQYVAQDHDRKIEAAEAHLAWLRAMPVPPGDEAPAAEA